MELDESLLVKGRDIIVIGIQAWGIEIGSNCKNIALEFSKHNRVLYVDPPIARISAWQERNTKKIKRFKRVQNGLEPNLIQLNDRMWNMLPKSVSESISWISNPTIFDWLNRLNATRFANDINEAVLKLGFTDYLVFNDSSMFLGQHIRELVKPSLYVYYMRDYLIKIPYWRRQGLRLEPKLIADADLVVNNSMLYAEYGKQYNEHSYMVGQGCDTSLFNDLDRTIVVDKELESISKPIIGYVGYLSGIRLSIEILEYIAIQRPQWSIVLVGPEDEEFKASNLHNLENVYFLGSKDPESLPDFIQGFDIAMNPQLKNDNTIGNYPRKIDEYLSMGKPTLATHTKAMEYFKDYTYLGNTKEEYVALIELALNENSETLEQNRRDFGHSHSWENNVCEIYKYISVVETERNMNR